MVENKKLVIACSSKFEKEIEDWKEYFEKQGYQVINYPKKIDQENEKVYKEVYLKFFKSLDETDILFYVVHGTVDGQCGNNQFKSGEWYFIPGKRSDGDR